MKQLSDYAFKMEEANYHSKQCLSYSILSQYERNGGFKWLPEKWEDLWAPSPKSEALLFGGAVDALITDGQDKFNAEYRVLDIPPVQDKIKQVIDRMIELGIEWHDTDGMLRVLDEMQLYPTWRKETRVNKLNEGYAYYQAVATKDNRRILTRDVYEHVLSVCQDLHNSNLVSSLMFDALPSHQERFFQLKFSTRFGGIEYKIMCDMIIVDHEKKEINIYDLKTTGKESYSFNYSYLDFGYHIQSWLYRMVLEDVLCLTDYSDYKIKDFYFIVASKVAGEPCVYRDDTPVEGKKFRNPLIIGKEIVDAYKDGTKKSMPQWCDASKVNVISFE